MQKILVTGASGFVGCAVVKALSQISPAALYVTCRQISDELRSLAATSKQIHIIDGIDLTDISHYHRLPGDLTHVVHCMAHASFAEKDETLLERSNVKATDLLAKHIKLTSGETIVRFLYASTIGVHDRPFLASSEDPLIEDSPLSPSSQYCKTKLDGERHLKEYNIPLVIARLGWIYGPQMRESSHIRTFVHMSLHGNFISRINLPGRIMAGYIDDTGQAIAALLLKDTLAHDTYLVAHSEPVSIGSVFSFSSKILSGKSRSMLPSWVFAPFRFVNRLFPMAIRCVLEDYLVCRTDRLANEGIHLTTPLPLGLRRSIEEGNWGDETVHQMNETVLITGAASGLGQALSEEAHARGYDLCLVDINPAVAEEANQLGAEYKILDLTDSNSVNEATNWRNDVHIVINNAGVGTKHSFHEMSGQAIDEILDLNIGALTRLSWSYLGKFANQGRGVLVNIGSTAHLFSTPTMAPYGGSKAYVNTFTDSLIAEYEEYPDICILGISPSGIRTSFQSNAGVPNETPERLLDPKYVAGKIFDRIEAKRSGNYYIGLSAWIFSLSKRLLSERLHRSITAALFRSYR